MVRTLILWSWDPVSNPWSIYQGCDFLIISTWGVDPSRWILWEVLRLVIEIGFKETQICLSRLLQHGLAHHSYTWAAFVHIIFNYLFLFHQWLFCVDQFTKIHVPAFNSQFIHTTNTFAKRYLYIRKKILNIMYTKSLFLTIYV